MNGSFIKWNSVGLAKEKFAIGFFPSYDAVEKKICPWH